MNPYYQGKLATIYYGDCRELTFANVSAVVTDPPYELGFMGKSWDSKGVSFQKETWEHLRIACLPGAPLLSFGGTRTFHRIACAIEDAGWEIRDTIMYVYGSGFPKSLDISKAIDKRRNTDIEQFAKYIKERREATGISLKDMNGRFDYVAGCNWWEAKGDNFRFPNWNDYQRLKGILGLDDRYDDYLKVCIGEKIAESIRGNAGFSNEQVPRPWKEKIGETYDITAPATPEAQLWEGYGTALKPAYEPVLLCMNPLEGTFAQNALKHKVAGLNIDECRVPCDSVTQGGSRVGHNSPFFTGKEAIDLPRNQTSRFPANFIHDGSDEVLELFPNTKAGVAIRHKSGGKTFGGDNLKPPMDDMGYGDNGSAARFFYCAKASRSERDAGLEGMPAIRIEGRDVGQDERNVPYKNRPAPQRNQHPTVKPLALMEYLCKLVKMPEYNLILDSFMGSGTTLLACIRLGIPCIGIDNDEHTCEIAARRCENALPGVENCLNSFAP